MARGGMTAGFEILPGLPGTGPLPEQYSATGRGAHREGFVVRFSPREGAPWVGNFQLGLGGCNGVFAHPNGSDLVIIAAGQGYVLDPESRTLSGHFGADISTVIEVPERNLLVFANGLWFEATGASGTVWQSRRVSWDGVRSVRRVGLTLEGEAYSPLDGEWHPFSLDLVSGHAEGGSYNGPPEGSAAQ